MPSILYTLIFGWLFLALHCLSPSYHFFLPAPKVKWEAAARSLLRAPFSRSLEEGRASPSPPAWWPTALTFRAHCQPHLLTQAFANKGSSHCSALSFEDASSFAHFLLLPNIRHWNSWIQIMEGSPDGETSDSCIHIRPFSLQQILTASNMKKADASAQLPKKLHTGFWKQCAFPFFCLLFWKPENSLSKQHARVDVYRETQAGGPIRGCQHWKEVALGEIWLDPNPDSYFVLQKKNQADLFSSKG